MSQKSLLCNFRAEIDFFALIDCYSGFNYCKITCVFSSPYPVLWALKKDHTLIVPFRALLTLTKLFYLMKTIFLPCFIFMPPTSKKLRMHIGLGLSVRPSVRPSVRLWVTLALRQEPIEIGS